jgi:hypothetical protein
MKPHAGTETVQFELVVTIGRCSLKQCCHKSQTDFLSTDQEIIQNNLHATFLIGEKRIQWGKQFSIFLIN